MAIKLSHLDDLLILKTMHGAQVRAETLSVVEAMDPKDCRSIY